MAYRPYYQQGISQSTRGEMRQPVRRFLHYRSQTKRKPCGDVVRHRHRPLICWGHCQTAQPYHLRFRPYAKVHSVCKAASALRFAKIQISRGRHFKCRPDCGISPAQKFRLRVGQRGDPWAFFCRQASENWIIGKHTRRRRIQMRVKRLCGVCIHLYIRINSFAFIPIH